MSKQKWKSFKKWVTLKVAETIFTHVPSSTLRSRTIGLLALKIMCDDSHLKPQHTQLQVDGPSFKVKFLLYCFYLKISTTYFVTILQNFLEFYIFMIMCVIKKNTSFPIALIFSSASRNHFSAVFQLRIEGVGGKKSKLVKSFH